jgi:hypothetical protein
VLSLPDTNAWVVDHTIYTLDPTDDERLRAWQTERFESLDDAQSRAVCAFLRHMSTRETSCDANTAQRAIDAYWRRFERASTDGVDR